MVDWTPIAVLPNVCIQTTKLTGPHIALLGEADPRYQECLKQDENLRIFLTKFTGSHGERLWPSFIAISSNYNSSPQAEAVASFRDLVIASVVLDSRVSSVLSVSNRGPTYSDSFDIYPWMKAIEGDRVVANSPAILALHTLEDFRGLAAPALPVYQVGDGSVDADLFARLYSMWQNRYINERDNWESRVILRSLNTATAAMRLPVTSVAETIYDWGRVISLWVSAFEILVHPGANGRADQNMVLTMLSAIEWRFRAVADAVYSMDHKGKMATLPEFLYSRIYKLRNDYIHGNPVDLQGFNMKNGTSVLSYPAALYRVALDSKVPSSDLAIPDGARSEGKSDDGFRMSFRSSRFAISCERCLLRAVDPNFEYSDE